MVILLGYVSVCVAHDALSTSSNHSKRMSVIISYFWIANNATLIHFFNSFFLLESLFV